MKNTDPPIILLPGMGAGGRLLRLQRDALPSLCTPDWIDPREREPLNIYARRFADRIAPAKQCFVGGVSFGGIVALEMAAHLHAEACFLIASVRSRNELPWPIRMLRPIARLGPNGLGRAATCITRAMAPLLPARALGHLIRLSRPESAFLRWASWAVLTWRPSAELARLRVYQIHGSADRTLPLSNTQPDVIIAGAGHLLPITHPDAISEFIRERLHGCEESHRCFGHASPAVDSHVSNHADRLDPDGN